MPWLGGIVVIALLLDIFCVWNQSRQNWLEHGQRSGASYCGDWRCSRVYLWRHHGITEAAGMGAMAVLIIAILRGEGSFDLLWESLMRPLRSTGTIIWVTIGAASLAGAYTIAGGPQPMWPISSLGVTFQTMWSFL